MDTKESSANASVAGATAQQSQNGVVGSVKGVIIISSVTSLCTIAVYKAVQYLMPNPKNPSAKSDTNYVFCSAEGQAVVLSEHDVFSIVQMYEDGILPSVIASKYNMDSVMICRIVNSFKY